MAVVVVSHPIVEEVIMEVAIMEVVTTMAEVTIITIQVKVNSCNFFKESFLFQIRFQANIIAKKPFLPLRPLLHK